MGVRGKFLTIIKDMYQNSRMQISFGMKRGTRQGCPLSPLLFIIFVNHLLKETSCSGVTVPGMRFNFRVAEERASLRARLSAKLKYTDGIKTWLKILHENPLRSLQRTWVTTNQRWERITLRSLQKYDGVPL